MDGGVLTGTTIVLIALVALALLTVFKGVRTVPQGEVWTVERFGRFTRLLGPGLNVIIPFIDNVGRRMNVQEVVLDIPEQSVITHDNATVTVDGIVYYRVMDPAMAAYQVQNLQAALTALSMTNIRAVIGGLDLDQTLSSRDRINSSLLDILDGATAPWGVKISRVEIRRIEPPENLVRAMNMQMTAERERRATVARADGEREASVKRAEGAKAAQVLEAEGRREAAFRDAEARERLAEAEARATNMVAEAAATGAGTDALRYFVADRYVAAFQAMAENPSSRLVVVPMEASALAGGVSAALELLRAVPAGAGPATTGQGFGPGRPAVPPAPSVPPGGPVGGSPWQAG